MARPLWAAILHTVAYYDALDRPLSAPEIAEWLFGCQADASAVAAEIERSLQLRTALACQNGYYTLAGQLELVQRRKALAPTQRRQWRRAEAYGALAQYVPFVRCLIVGGSLALGTARSRSDVDLVCLTASGRLWTARLGLSAARTLWGRPRVGADHASPETAERFAPAKPPARRAIDLVEMMALDGLAAGRQSWHTAAVLHQGVVLFEEGRTAEDFVAANGWVRAYRPAFSGLRRAERQVRPRPAPLIVKRTLERLLSGRLGDAFEAAVYHAWSAHWRRQWPRHEFTSGRIVATPQQACPWAYYWEERTMGRYSERLAELGLTVLW